MSSRIEALCILVLCLFGICYSSVGVEERIRTGSGSVVLRIPGVPVDLEVRAVVGNRCSCELEPATMVPRAPLHGSE